MSINVSRIRETFEKLKPQAEDFYHSFYERLFEKYPQTKPMFQNTSIEKQGPALVNALAFAVDHLEQPEKLQEALERLGAGHLDYGVEQDHYEIVGENLLAVLAEYLGDDWDEETEISWAHVFGAVAQMMLQGAQKRIDSESPAEPRANSSDWNLTEIADEVLTNVPVRIPGTVAEELKSIVRERIRDRVVLALKAIAKEESERLEALDNPEQVAELFKKAA